MRRALSKLVKVFVSNANRLIHKFNIVVRGTARRETN